MSGKKNNIIKEPVVAYSARTDTSFNSFLSLLGGNSVLKLQTYSSDFDILELTRRGIPKKSLLQLAKRIAVTLHELANILHISERTLQRYENDAVVKSEYSEKAIELARLYSRGEEVFGSLELFKSWMKSPSHVFKGQTPLSLLDTSIGFHLVLQELGRIEHGVFS